MTLTSYPYYSKLENRYVFIASFCENGDLLSQWKGYANYGEGYSISIPINALKEIPNVVIGRVIYNDTRKDAIIDKIIKGILEDKENYDRIGEEKFLETVFLLIEYFSCFFKSQFFEEEKEWRLVFHYKEEFGYKIIHRISKYGTIPYVEIDIPKGVESIENIIVGPKYEITLNRKALIGIFDAKKIQKSSNSLQ